MDKKYEKEESFRPGLPRRIILDSLKKEQKEWKTAEDVFAWWMKDPERHKPIDGQTDMWEEGD